MKYLGVLVAIGTVPLLMFGVAMNGVRIYSTEHLTLIDVAGLVLQILLIVALVLMAIGLWKRHNKRPSR